MTAVVRCASCHRTERWGDTVEVVSAGGSRRPRVHPTLASFRTALGARRRKSGAVVGWCEACGQPLVQVEGAATPLAELVFETPGGTVTMRQGIEGPEGVMSDSDASAFMEEMFREPWEVKPGLALFQGSVLSLMLVPVLLWLVAVSVVAFFMWSGFGLL